MEFLRGIVADYGKVKAAVYERYSGIANLGKLASVFDIMTEMRHCGLREQLNLPSVYYELAVKEAVTDIKSGWSMLKNKLRTRITANENLSDDDRMYLRTILKMDEAYAAILNRSEYQMPEKVRGADIDTKRLNNLLRRLTRKYLGKPVVSRTDSFSVPPVGYSYKGGTLCLASRTRRKRVALPLKDNKTSNRQIRVCMKENYAAIAIPVEVKKQKHHEFLNTIYVHLGYQNMCTLSSGCVYGRDLGSLLEAKTERLMEKNRERARMRTAYRKSLAAGDVRKAARIEENSLGLRKYDEQKCRERREIADE